MENPARSLCISRGGDFFCYCMQDVKSPNFMKTGQLVVIEGTNSNLQQIFLVPRKTIRLVGRSSVCHFRLLDPLVSTIHCLVDSEENKMVVRDLLSANGVFVNGQLIDNAVLNVRDRIQLGKTLLEFSECEENAPVSDDAKSIENVEGNKLSTPNLPLGRMIKKTRDLNICRLAIKNRMLNHAQLRDMVALQQQHIQQGHDCDLAELLVSQNVLQQQRIENLLKEHNYYKFRNKDIHFAKALVKQGSTKEERIQECLQLQERYFEETNQIQRLGEILVNKGYLSVRDNNRLIKALARRREEDL